MDFLKKHLDPILFILISLTVAFIACYEVVNWFGFYANFGSETDMAAYLKQANGLLDGTWPHDKAFYRAPLYPYFLAFLKIIGRGDNLVAFLQCYFLCGAITLCGLSAKILFGRKAGWIAFLLFLFYAPVYIFSIHFHSTVLEVFLSSVVLFLFVLLNKRDHMITTVALGLAGALLVLVRPNYLPIIPLVYLFQSWQHKFKRHHIYILFIMFCLPLLCVMIRNNIYEEHFVLLTTNGAETWRLSNASVSSVFNFVNHSEDAMPVMSIDFIKLFFNKCLGYWWNVEVGQNLSPAIITENSITLKILFVNHALLGALFIVSCFFLFKEKELRPFILMFWLYYFTICAFFIISRFRMPNLPVMILLISGMLYQISEIPKKKLLFLGLGFVILFGLMRPFDKQWDAKKERINYVVTALNYGNLLEAENQLAVYLDEKDDLEMHMYLWSVRIIKGEKADTLRGYEMALHKLYKDEMTFKITSKNILNFKKVYHGVKGSTMPIKAENTKYDCFSKVMNSLPRVKKESLLSN